MFNIHTTPGETSTLGDDGKLYSSTFHSDLIFTEFSQLFRGDLSAGSAHKNSDCLHANVDDDNNFTQL